MNSTPPDADDIRHRVLGLKQEAKRVAKDTDQTIDVLMAHVPVARGFCAFIPDEDLENRQRVAEWTEYLSMVPIVNLLGNFAWRKLIWELFETGSPDKFSSEKLANVVAAIPSVFLLPEVQRFALSSALDREPLFFAALAEAIRQYRKAHRDRPKQREDYRRVRFKMHSLSGLDHNAPGGRLELGDDPPGVSVRSAIQAIARVTPEEAPNNSLGRLARRLAKSHQRETHDRAVRRRNAIGWNLCQAHAGKVSEIFRAFDTLQVAKPRPLIAPAVHS